MHGAFLIIAGGKKMAKSEGNFLTLEASFSRKGIDPLAFRFASFLTHYRKPMEYSDEGMAAAQNGLQHLRNQVRTLMDSGARSAGIDAVYQQKFNAALNNDLNMPQVLAVVQELLKSDLDDGVKLATVMDFDRVLGLDLDKVSAEQVLPPEIQTLVDTRQQARREKNWSLSDQLRDQIQALGYTVQDSKEGMKVYKQ